MTTPNPWLMRAQDAPDLDILEEAALAMAQATIQNAINKSGISRAELARRLGRPRSFVSRLLSGDHNLTIRTMARALLACGYEVRFGSEPLTWGLPHTDHPTIVIEGEQFSPAEQIPHLLAA